MNNWDSVKNKVGNPYQVAGTRHYMLINGSTLGTRAIDVKTGAGFEYTVLPDRGLDISLASYKGENLVYLGPMGEKNPAFYDNRGLQWLRMFFGGLLTTCGPGNIGPPCTDNNEELGLHGRHSSTPASNVCDLSDIEAGVIRITGEIVSAVLFGEHLRIKRTITSPIGEAKVRIEDTIQNESGHTVPMAMLYHINFGYPLLDDCVSIRTNGSSVKPHDDYSDQYLNTLESFAPPDAGNTEKNYMHCFGEDTKKGHAGVYNPKLKIGVEISFDTNELPYLMQWKQEGIKDYALALEPSNAPCLKRSVLREQGKLPFLAPGEKKRHSLEVSILTKEPEVNK
jgi:hypothetical protein